MDNNLKQEDIQDTFLQDFLHKNLRKENVSDDFTKKTMDIVMQEWINNPVEIKKSKHGYIYWLITGAVIIIAAAIFLATDTRKIITMSDITWLKSFDKQYLIYIHSFFLNTINTFLGISPIIYIVLSAVFTLYFVDKLLKKTHSVYTFLFV